MKTIYTLKTGDNYFIKNIYNECEQRLISSNYDNSGSLKKINDEWVTKVSIETYNDDLISNEIFLTKEDVEKSIKKEKSLLKIKKRAIELNRYWVTEQDDFKPAYIKYDKNGSLVLVRPDDEEEDKVFNKSCYTLAFDNYHIADYLIEEMPEDIKIVLSYKKLKKD